MWGRSCPTPPHFGPITDDFKMSHSWPYPCVVILLPALLKKQVWVGGNGDIGDEKWEILFWSRLLPTLINLCTVEQIHSWCHNLENEVEKRMYRASNYCWNWLECKEIPPLPFYRTWFANLSHDSQGTCSAGRNRGWIYFSSHFNMKLPNPHFLK